MSTILTRMRAGRRTECRCRPWEKRRDDVQRERPPPKLEERVAPPRTRGYRPLIGPFQPVAWCHVSQANAPRDSQQRQRTHTPESHSRDITGSRTRRTGSRRRRCAGEWRIARNTRGGCRNQNASISYNKDISCRWYACIRVYNKYERDRSKKRDK